MVNSLAQTVLKAAVPGMPDFYQGTELWDFSLVDPDNRRLVNYEARRLALSFLEGANPSVLLNEWRDGRIKLHVTYKLLHFRRSHPALFMQGGFTSLAATGAFGDSCVVFLRRFEDSALLLIVPRLTARLGFPPVGDVWKDTVVEWPEEFTGKEVCELFTGVKFTVSETSCAIAEALRVLPVAAYALV
jgi:(1->4)-alpha-D-glucan 1-alpha-D-glucosylmutase